MNPKSSFVNRYPASKTIALSLLFLIIAFAASFAIYNSLTVPAQAKNDQKPDPVEPSPLSPTATSGTVISSVGQDKVTLDNGADQSRTEVAKNVVKLTLPPQGLYDSCIPTEAGCLSSLAEMSAKGFKVILNDGLRYVESAKSLKDYADYASKLGMKVILPVKYSPNWDTDDSYLVKKFPALASEGQCKDNKEFITYYLSILKDHSALWGYYIADEIHPENYTGLKKYADLVKQIDPDRPRLIVEEGSNDPMEIFFTFPSFMSDTADVLGIDYYPYGLIDQFETLTRFTGASARTAQNWSDKLKLRNAIVLQAFALPQYYGLTEPQCLPYPLCAPFPNYDQMKAQRDQAILNSKPDIILWFSYPDIKKSDNPAKHWKDLTEAAFSPLPSPVSPVNPRSHNCPMNWNCEDIGSPLKEGKQTLDNGIWTLEGSGWNIGSEQWVKADQFHFVWQNMVGDGELSARVISLQNTKKLTKAGIMVRKTFDPIAPFYALLVTPDGIQILYRPDFGQDHLEKSSGLKDLPLYLKIVRKGTEYSAYSSKDALTWNLVPNSTVTLAKLDGSLLGGLAVTSGDENMVSSSSFDNVKVTGFSQ